jgi:hypothetical protein
VRTLLTLTLLLALAGSAGSATAPKKRTPTPAGPIEAIAMDGPRVAFDVGAKFRPGPTCNKVYVWNVLTGAVQTVSGKATCTADNTSTGAGVREVAIAGKRVAWIANLGGNSESDDYLYTASLPKPKERRIAFARRSGVAGGALAGDWIGGLVGAGNVLAANMWTTAGLKNMVLTATLNRVNGTGLHPIASGVDSMVARSTDGARVAVLRSNGTVGVYSSAGGPPLQIAPTSSKEIALRGDLLAVLTKTRGIEVYNSHTGARLHTWPVPSAAAHLDLASGLAVYALGRQIHVLNVTTGRDRVLDALTHRVAAVELEPQGLVYVVNKRLGRRTVARLFFVPMKRLPR